MFTSKEMIILNKLMMIAVLLKKNTTIAIAVVN